MKPRTLGKIDALSRNAIALPFACLLALLTHLLAPHCLLRSRAPLCSFVRLLARSLTHSRAHGKEVFVCGMNALISYSFNPLCSVRVLFYPLRLISNQGPNHGLQAVRLISSCFAANECTVSGKTVKSTHLIRCVCVLFHPLRHKSLSHELRSE